MVFVCYRFYRKLIDYLMDYKYHNSSYVVIQILGVIGNFPIYLCILSLIWINGYVLRGLYFFVINDNTTFNQEPFTGLLNVIYE